MRKLTKTSLCLYLVFFISIIILFTATFDALSFIFRPTILVPVSYAGFLILKRTGIPVMFDGPIGFPGYCEYQLPHTTLQVTFGCIGIFVLFILISGIIAFPSSFRSKGIGLLIAIPAFYFYSMFRLVIIGIVGNWFPEYIDFVHSYLMEIINVGFILFVYVIWIRYVEKIAQTI